MSPGQFTPSQWRKVAEQSAAHGRLGERVLGPLLAAAIGLAAAGWLFCWWSS